MSKDLPQPQQSEEVDLGQLFKLIGNAFDRFFKFIGSIFKGIFLAFVWFVFFIKRHILKFVIAGVFGIILGFILQKTLPPVYKSAVTIKQNYPTGENLYGIIGYYKDLIKQEDTIVLKNTLKIEMSQASSILDIDIEPVVSDNQMLKNFDAYIKTIDSALASTVNYEAFIDNSESYTHQYQQITIKAKNRNNFETFFKSIVDEINSNAYFKREQEKDSLELANRKQTLKEALVESDSLKDTYKRVLEKVLDKNEGAQTSITIANADEQNKTKEYDLFINDIDIRRELVALDREIANKELIIEIVSGNQSSGALNDKIEVFGFMLDKKLFYGLLLMSLTFLVLIGLEFIAFLERFKK